MILTDHKLDVPGITLWKAGFVCRVTFCRKKKLDSCHLRKSRGRKFKQPAELFQIDDDRKDKAGLKAWMGDPC